MCVLSNLISNEVVVIWLFSYIYIYLYPNNELKYREMLDVFLILKIYHIYPLTNGTIHKIVDPDDNEVIRLERKSKTLVV